jgi:hypothetical protein
MGARMSNSPSSITVGCRVETTDSPPKSGVVVEDFGDLAGEDVVIDRERTAHSRRWAVVLDDGRLVFCDDGSVHAIE